MASKTHALSFKVLAECKTTKARVGKMKLPHYTVDTPVFMPVGTQGTLKGLAPEQLEELDCKIMLGNTYHLGHRPGPDLLEKAGGLHKFMNWNRALLTDSGGFQMVSLLKLAEITEQGVKFESPHDGSEMMLTPEKSIEIQNSIGADIIMQLDDVVHSSTTGPRVEEAMWRTIRWLDRCLTAHRRPHDQNIFPIVQGGLDPELRKKCAEELTKRDVAGFAIGGLSGGEEKKQFWRMVDVSTDCLPTDKPRYLMGVGFAVDLVVCVALGCDMFDCVYPTRTARFGNALVPSGKLNLKQQKFEKDFQPIDKNCQCSTCRNYTRAYLHMVIDDAVASSLLSVHNVAYQLDLMRSIQRSILEARFPDFIRDFFKKMFPDEAYPDWAVEALRKVNVDLRTGGEDTYRPKDSQKEAHVVETVEGDKHDKMKDFHVVKDKTNDERELMDLEENRIVCDAVPSKELYHRESGDCVKSVNTQLHKANVIKHNAANAETTGCKGTENVIK